MVKITAEKDGEKLLEAEGEFLLGILNIKKDQRIHIAVGVSSPMETFEEIAIYSRYICKFFAEQHDVPMEAAEAALVDAMAREFEGGEEDGTADH